MIDVVFSSINLAGSRYGLMPLEWLGKFAREAHCDGVEYMPLYDMLPGRTPKAVGQAVKSGALVLNSLHATFRETRNSASELTDVTKKRTARSKIMSSKLGRVVLPEVTESAKILRAIQNQANIKIPVTLYPQRSLEGELRQINDAGGSRHLFQPMDGVARLTNSTSLTGFDEEMRITRGYDYAVDTYHIRRRYGNDGPGLVSDTTTSVPLMAPHTRSLHLSLNRSDMSREPHIPTLEEAKQALQGEYTGELRDILDAIKDNGDPGFVVIEATLGGIAMASGYSDLGDIQKGYADIADGFRSYWEAN